MKNNIKAKIQLLPGNKDGPITLSPGSKFVAPVIFPKDKNQKNTWSLMIKVKSDFEPSGCFLADINYLMDNAPKHLLTPGNEFELLSGHRSVIARGVVLP